MVVGLGLQRLGCFRAVLVVLSFNWVFQDLVHGTEIHGRSRRVWLPDRERVLCYEAWRFRVSSVTKRSRVQVSAKRHLPGGRDCGLLDAPFEAAGAGAPGPFVKAKAG